MQPVNSLIYFPFLVLSNAFTPTTAFPGWLQPVVAHQPVSRAADALRALAAGGTGLAEPVLIAAGWLAGLLALGTVGARALGRQS